MKKKSRCVEGGYKRDAQYLIAQGADVNAKDNEGITPLHLAAKNNLLELVQIFFENNAQVDPTDTVVVDFLKKHPDMCSLIKK